MRCFGWRRRNREGEEETADAAITISSPQRAAAPSEPEEEEETCRKREINGGSPSSTTSASASAAASPATTTTISLNREYTLAVQTESYEEIWSKIHRERNDDEDEEPHSSSHLVSEVLHPGPDAVAAALRAAPHSRLSRLVSRYMDGSERTSHLFLSLRRSLDQARSLYRPIADLLDLLPTSPAPHLSQPQRDWALDAFVRFDRLDNPFSAPTTSIHTDSNASSSGGGGFAGMRSCFLELRQQLESRLLLTRRRHRLLRRSTHGAAACLLLSVAGLAITVPIIAAHALAALLAGPALCLPPRDPLEGRRRRLREHMVQLDAAARGAYVLHNDLDTVERLVARLHATVESDKALVRLGLEPGHRCPVEEVLRQLRKNHPALLHQLRDLDEHVCLCFAAVNRARSLLLQHLHHHQHRRHSL